MLTNKLMILTPSQMLTSGHMRTYDDTKRICIKYLTNYTLSSNFILELGNFAVDVYDTLSCKKQIKFGKKKAKTTHTSATQIESASWVKINSGIDLPMSACSSIRASAGSLKPQQQRFSKSCLSNKDELHTSLVPNFGSSFASLTINYFERYVAL
uniref:Uncharacterized protein n=1 Tax=Glossina pallidipes TaxID=7398 RepID=A0A1A9ZV72_GLOPL